MTQIAAGVGGSDHLRVCGADAMGIIDRIRGTGSPCF